MPHVNFFKGPYPLGDICMIDARIGSRIGLLRLILAPIVAPILVGMTLQLLLGDQNCWVIELWAIHIKQVYLTAMESAGEVGMALEKGQCHLFEFKILPSRHVNF